MRGEKREGKPCRKCGGTLRYVTRNRCVACAQAEALARHKANPEVARARTREWHRNNPARRLLQSSRLGARKGGYVPMSLEECEKALAAKAKLTHDACPVCGRDGPLVADHNHVTGKFRGWICADCNLAEGCLRSPENALRLADYMEAA